MTMSPLRHRWRYWASGWIMRSVSSSMMSLPPRAVGPELVDAQHGDLGIVRVARHLRRVGQHDAEAPAVAQEVFDLEILARHHDHVAVEPHPVDRGEARVVERLDVDAENLGADLRSQAANLNH